VGQSGPAGTTTYEYSVLGDRTAVTLGGVRTEYLVDPTGQPFPHALLPSILRVCVEWGSA